MQVLWSRAAQARSSCRCSSCLHAATTVARQTTTAASRRRLKISDVFTACYSTILATAAFADARRKEDRRKEWDKLIDEVKTPSKQGKKRKKARKGLEEEPGPEQEAWEVQQPSAAPSEVAKATLSTPNPLRDRSSNGNYTSWQDDYLDAWGLPPRTKVPSPGERLSPLDHKLRNSTAERIAARDVDSIYRPGLNQDGEFVDEFLDVDMFNREPLKPLHVEKLEEMVMNLVNRLMQESKVFSNSVPPEGDTPSTVQRQLSEMAQCFVALNIGVSRVPRFHFDDVEFVEAERNKLHHSIWALSFSATRGQTDSNVAIAKICYNLLVSDVPPTITTYNLLLNQFHNLKRNDLGQVVIDSFFYESKLRPNKRTIRLFLDHYRTESNFKGFQEVIRRMRATEGDMRVHARHLNDLAYLSHEKWALDNKVIHRNGALLQKAPRSRAVYNSLILGSLEFRQPRGAVRFARAALREGQAISVDTLCAVIKAIVRSKDFYAGQSLLRALVSQWENGSIISVTEYPTDLRLVMNQLLLLCGIDTNSKRWRDMLPSGMSPVAFSNIVQRLQLGFIADAVEWSAKFILKLDAALGMSGLDFSYSEIEPDPSAEDTADQRLQWAQEVILEQSRHEQLQHTKNLSATREAWQRRLHVLGRIVNDGTSRVLMLEGQLWRIKVVSKSLKLHSLLQEKTTMNEELVRKYLLALETSSTRYQRSAYPIFQQGLSLQHGGDPISYLEANLFDSKNLKWHQRLMSDLLSTEDISYRERLTEMRLKTIKNLLNRYLKRPHDNMVPKNRFRKIPEEEEEEVQLRRMIALYQAEKSAEHIAGVPLALDEGLASFSPAYSANNVQDIWDESAAELDAVDLVIDGRPNSASKEDVEKESPSLSPVALLPPLEPLSKRVDVVTG